MGGTSGVLKAKTKKELKDEFNQWKRQVVGMGLTDIRLGWDLKRIKKTKNGYEIGVWAHS